MACLPTSFHIQSSSSMFLKTNEKKENHTQFEYFKAASQIPERTLAPHAQVAERGIKTLPSCGMWFCVYMSLILSVAGLPKPEDQCFLVPGSQTYSQCKSCIEKQVFLFDVMVNSRRLLVKTKAHLLKIKVKNVKQSSEHSLFKNSISFCPLRLISFPLETIHSTMDLHSIFKVFLYVHPYIRGEQNSKRLFSKHTKWSQQNCFVNS